jgi:hypothetical protein
VGIEHANRLVENLPEVLAELADALAPGSGRSKIKTLEANQTRLVQMSYEGLVCNEVLATEQRRLEGEKHQAQQLLEAAEMHASDIETALDGALAKTKTPHATYVASTPLERRLLNQTFFKRILVGEEGTIESAELTTVYAALATWEPSLGKPRHLKAVPSPAKGANKMNPDPVSGARVHTTTFWWSQPGSNR